MAFNGAEEAQDYVSSHPEIAEIARQIPFLDPATVTSRIFSVRNVFKRKGIDIAKPCSRNDEAGCWLLEYVTLCNRILFSVDVQLRESKPGVLNVSPIPSDDEIFSEVAVLDSLYLICWLVKQHPCIQGIDLHETRLFVHFPTALKLALAHGSNIKSVKAGTLEPSTQHNVFLEGARPDTMLEHFEARNLIFDTGSASRLSQVIERSSQLKSIVLSRSSLSKKDMKLVFKALLQCSNLTSLQIYGCHLKGDAAVYLAKIVKCGRHLKNFLLCRIPDDILEIVAIALKENTSIEDLKVNESDGITRTMPYLADTLKTNETIRTLELNQAGIGEHEVCLLAQALRVNVTLQKLQLRENRFEDSGARHLAEALETNQTLRDLDITSSQLSTATLVQFVKTLTVNTSLQVVHLGTIDFADEVDEGLAQVITGHECCHRICTPWNTVVLNELARLISFDRADIEKIYISSMEDTPLFQVISALESNCHITEVYLDTTVIFRDTAEALAQLFEKTRSLKLVHCMCTFSRDGALATFIKGLRKNDTIGLVELHEAVPFDMEAARAFSAMLDVNKTLYAFLAEMPYFDEGTVRVIAKHFPRNHTLSQFCEILSGYVNSRGHRKILGALQRNEQMLNRATRFALGTCRDSDCREAFRILWKCDSVVHQVKYVTECAEEDARRCVEAAKLLFL